LKNKDYIPNKGKYFNQRPGQFVVSIAAITDVAFIQYITNIPFTFFYLRQPPTNGVLTIYGDEYGARAMSNTVNAIGVISANAVTGSPTITRVTNAISLDATNNIHIFDLEPWRTRYLYFQGSVIGSYILNYSYIY